MQESAGQYLRIFHTNAHRLALEAGRVKSSKHEQEHDKGPAECVGADHGADGDVAPQPPGVGGVGDLDVIESDGDDGEIVQDRKDDDNHGRGGKRLGDVHVRVDEAGHLVEPILCLGAFGVADRIFTRQRGEVLPAVSV